MDDLSPRQLAVLEAIRQAVRLEGRVPTVRELASALRVQAPGTIQDHLRALERKGYLTRGQGHRNLRLSEAPEASDALRLPVLGRIAAGRPLEAIPELEYLEVREDLQLEGAYVLRVKGTSMIEDHIADGDYVVVQPCATARDGEIVVALLPEGEATLKRFYREADRIRLQPANSSMEPIYAREVTLQGRVVAVLRTVR